LLVLDVALVLFLLVLLEVDMQATDRTAAGKCLKIMR